MGKPNAIKKGGGDDVRLQITKPARAAGLVRENSEGEWTALSDVHVWGFDGLLLVIGDDVDMAYRADLVSKAAGYTESVHGGYRATVSEAGNGYQVQLPGARSAGFEVGDDAPVVTADSVLVIHDGDGSQLATDLAAIRREQSK